MKREIKMAAPWSPVSVWACQFSAFNRRVRLSSILLPINAWILSSWADKSWKWPFSCKFQCSFFSHVQICCDHLNFLMWFWTWCLVCEPLRRGPKIRIEVFFTKVYGWNLFCPCFWTNPDHYHAHSQLTSSICGKFLWFSWSWRFTLTLRGFPWRWWGASGREVEANCEMFWLYSVLFEFLR